MPRRTGTAIVVGASSGIGAALARRLALEGRKVAMLARREPELRAVAATIESATGHALPGRVHRVDVAAAQPSAV